MTNGYVRFYYAETPQWVLQDSLSLTADGVQEFLNRNQYEDVKIMSCEVSIEALLFQLMKSDKDTRAFFNAAEIKVMKLKT